MRAPSGTIPHMTHLTRLELTVQLNAPSSGGTNGSGLCVSSLRGGLCRFGEAWAALRAENFTLSLTWTYVILGDSVG